MIELFRTQIKFEIAQHVPQDKAKEQDAGDRHHGLLADSGPIEAQQSHLVSENKDSSEWIVF